MSTRFRKSEEDTFRVEPIAPWLGSWRGIVHLGVQSGKISPHEVETLSADLTVVAIKERIFVDVTLRKRRDALMHVNNTPLLHMRAHSIVNCQQCIP